MNYKIEVSLGENIISIVKKAYTLALGLHDSNGNRLNVEFDFNGITCIFSRETNPEWLIRDYHNAIIMDWKVIGPDCLPAYSAEVQSELTKRKEAAKKEQEQQRKDHEETKLKNRKASLSFTFFQILNLIDGRIFTKMDDIYELLNHLTGEDLFTHHLPVACDFVRSKNLKWWEEIEATLNAHKKMVGINSENMEDFHNHLKKFFSNVTYDIPALTEEEMIGFSEHMVDNSLFKKLGSGIEKQN